jgi:diaminopimelate epimerase
VRFIKMEGCGNDYVFVDAGIGSAAVDPDALGDPGELARRVSDRHRGIGSDGLIVLRPGESGPVRMTMYNADGSEGRLCLNGLRCAAKYAAETVREAGESFGVETAAGRFPVRVHRGPDGAVTEVEVRVPPPDFRRSALPALRSGDEIWGETFPAAGLDLPGYGVSVGNPHLVLWIGESAIADAPLEAIGRPLEGDPRFPEGVNVHLAAGRAQGGLVMRSWERGSGITQACGSGAVAVFAVARRLGRAPESCAVEMPGGEVRMRWLEDGSILMAGPALEVFRGDWPGA